MSWHLDYLLHGLKHLSCSLAIATSKRTFYIVLFTGESYTAASSVAIMFKNLAGTGAKLVNIRPCSPATMISFGIEFAALNTYWPVPE